MDYSARTYDDRSRGGRGPDEMLFSRASEFHLMEAPRRQLSVHVAHLDIPSASILRVTSSGHEIDLVDDELVTVMLPLVGVVRVNVGEHRHMADADGSLTFLPSARRSSVEGTHEGLFEALMLKMPTSHLRMDEEDERTHPIRAAGPRAALLRTSDDAVASLRELLAYAITDLASDLPVLRRRQTSRAFEILVQEQFLALFPDAGEERISLASAIKVRAAEELMRTRYAEPLSISMIALATGVGVRTLQSSFRAATGVSMRTRLSEIRLDQAYLKLIANTGQSVTDVALECGIAHLGRFSQAYYRRFGELPSDTRRRGQRRPFA